MAESTLTPTQTVISRLIAVYLGYHRFASQAEGLSALQEAQVISSRIAGEARFAGAHDWGAFRPRADFTLWPSVAVDAAVTVAQAGTTTLTATGGSPFYPSMIGKSIVITTVSTKIITGYTSSTVVTVDSIGTFSGKTFSIAADGTYRLPDDFGGMESTQIEFGRNSGHIQIINIISPALIEREWQLNNQTGKPRLASPRILANDGTGQRWELITWPIPDASYPVSFRYNSYPNAMGSTDYGSGGMIYADALTKCCLAAAEEQFNEDQNTMAAQEAKALEKAIKHDLKYFRNRRLGRTTTRNFRGQDEGMNSRANGFVYRGDLIEVETL